MKWLWSVSVTMVAASSIVTAQSGGTMGKAAMADKGMSETYVGCVEAGSTPGSFVLTHVSHESMHNESMKHDAMKKDSMMKQDGDAMHDMSMPMAPSSVMLIGSAVSKKQLGQKVSVTGPVTMGSQTTLAAKSVKVVAKSCS